MLNEQLANRIQQGDIDCLSVLWEQTSKLIYMLCWKYWRVYSNRFRSAGYEFADIKQEGFFILLQAVKGYKSEKGYRFTAYLNYAAKKVLLGLIGSKDALCQGDIISLEQSISEDEENSFTLSDIIADENAEKDFDEAESRIIHQQLHSIIGKLPERERKAITAYCIEGKTYQQIAADCGYSISGVRNIISRGLRLLCSGDDLQRLKDIYSAVD